LGLSISFIPAASGKGGVGLDMRSASLAQSQVLATQFHWRAMIHCGPLSKGLHGYKEVAAKKPAATTKKI
jgi:hypothetical protein